MEDFMINNTEYFTSVQIEWILDNAARLLEEVGIAVKNNEYLQRLSKMGFKTEGDRVKIDRSRFNAQLEQSRAMSDSEFTPKKQGHFNTHISAYSNTYEKHDTGAFEPITDISNQKMGGFVSHLSKMYPGLASNCPGHPLEVPADLQFLRQAVNSYNWCEGFRSMEPVSLKIAPYQFEICEVMGTPYESLPIYLASPLILAGESFDIVMQNAHKLKSVWVGSMPSLGAVTPLNIPGAYAQTIAETLGCAVITQELTGLKTDLSNSIFYFDFRATSMPFGTPEKLVLEFMNTEVWSKIRGQKIHIGSIDIHTNAPRAGIQAAVEKASLTMAGAMKGAKHFHTVGTIGMDEVFSPLQLVLDMEMLNHVEKIVEGIPVCDFDGDFIEEVRQGIISSYMQSDRTLNNYKDYNWNPRFFNRVSFETFVSQDLKDAEQKARDLITDLMKREPVWRLDELRAREIEALYEKAEKSL
jgi:trimethylamine:corrinoid methyltransferase-like protein